MQMRRFTAGIICILVLLGSFTGCSNMKVWMSNDGVQHVKKQTKLTWMHHFSEEGAIKWIDIGTDVFSLTRDGIVFDIVAVNGSDYVQLLRTKLASGDMPDIFMTDHIIILKEFIDAGYVLNLTNQSFIRKNIKDTAIPGATMYGKIWCEPIDTTMQGVIYNREVFQKAGVRQVPGTYKEFLEACKAIRKIGITPIGAPYGDTWTIRNDFNSDMIQSAMKFDPGWMLDIAEGRATWAENKAGFREALLRFGERSEFINRDPFNADWNEVTAWLADGAVGMVLNGTWTIDAVRSKGSIAKLGFFPFPWSDISAAVKMPVKTTGGIAINAKSPNRDMAIQVLDFFSRPEVGNLFQKSKKSISAIKGLEVNFEPAFDEIKGYMDAGRTVDYSTYFQDFTEDEFNKLLDDILTEFLLDSGRDVDRYIALLDEETRRLLKSAR
jgi:raffinose/stachyose/melibiose transport system substrate-binding protein